MRPALLLATLLAAFFFLAAPAARADDAAVAEARARFDEGVALAEAGKHDEARLKFEQAAAVLKAPPVLFNLARSEQLTGHDYEAVTHYEQFLRASESSTSVTDEQRAQAKQYIQELTPRIGRIDVVAPPGSRISIDGKPLDEAPKEPVPVPPGRHVVEAAHESKLKSVTVECAAGAVTPATIAFDPDTVEPPPIAPTPNDSTKWIVGGALGAAGLAGVGIGVGFAVASQNAKSDSEALRRQGLCGDPSVPDCVRFDSLRDDAQSDATAAKIGYVAGAVLLVSAVAAIVIWPKPEPRGAASPARATARVEPLVSFERGGPIGAALGGSF
jgi:hypothetical protein